MNSAARPKPIRSGATMSEASLWATHSITDQIVKTSAKNSTNPASATKNDQGSSVLLLEATSHYSELLGRTCVMVPDTQANLANLLICATKGGCALAPTDPALPPLNPPPDFLGEFFKAVASPDLSVLRPGYYANWLRHVTAAFNHDGATAAAAAAAQAAANGAPAPPAFVPIDEASAGMLAFNAICQTSDANLFGYLKNYDDNVLIALSPIIEERFAAEIMASISTQAPSANKSLLVVKTIADRVLSNAHITGATLLTDGLDLARKTGSRPRLGACDIRTCAQLFANPVASRPRHDHMDCSQRSSCQHEPDRGHPALLLPRDKQAAHRHGGPHQRGQDR